MQSGLGQLFAALSTLRSLGTELGHRTLTLWKTTQGVHHGSLRCASQTASAPGSPVTLNLDQLSGLEVCQHCWRDGVTTGEDLLVVLDQAGEMHQTLAVEHPTTPGQWIARLEDAQESRTALELSGVTPSLESAFERFSELVTALEQATSRHLQSELGRAEIATWFTSRLTGPRALVTGSVVRVDVSSDYAVLAALTAWAHPRLPRASVMPLVLVEAITCDTYVDIEYCTLIPTDTEEVVETAVVLLADDRDLHPYDALATARGLEGS